MRGGPYITGSGTRRFVSNASLGEVGLSQHRRGRISPVSSRAWGGRRNVCGGGAPSPSPQVLALDLRRAKSGAMAPLTITTTPPHTTPITAAKNALTSHFTRPAAPWTALAAATAAL